MPKAPQVLKVGIVGLGHLHPRLYMPLFISLPMFEVVAVCEGDSDLRHEFADDFHVADYSRLSEMLEAQELDVAAIFLPHADCPKAAERCAEKGLHLLVEKPMAASAEGAQRIVDAANTHNVKLTTGYCWRLHPVVAEIQRLLATGILGDPVGAEGRCAAGRLNRYIDGHSPWMLQKSLSGGGPMYNLGVHWIDLFRCLLGDDVAEVSGSNVKINQDYDIEDNSFAHLRFKSGAVAALDISYTVPDAFPHGRDLYLSIRGTQGVLSWAPAYEGEKDILHVVSDHPDFSGSPRREMSFELETVSGYSGIMGKAFLERFANAIIEGSEVPISGEDGVAALKVVEAIYAADKQKKWMQVEA